MSEPQQMAASRPVGAGIQRIPAPEVAAQRRDAATIEPLPGEPTTGFSPNSDEIMSSPRVFAIYWGRDFGTPTTGTNAVAQNFDAFFTTVLNSLYMNQLSQYGIESATFLGSTWVDHDPGTAQSFTFNDMAQLLTNWLDDGLTPVRPESNETNLLFVIFAPKEVTLTDNNGVSGLFCAYHYAAYYSKSSLFSKPNLFYAAIGSGSGTAPVAHEMVEAFTDRNPGQGWYTSSGPGAEIADVCNACGVGILTLNNFQVASYWLDDIGRCLQQSDLIPVPPPPPVPDLVVTINPPPRLGVAENYVVTVLNSSNGSPVSGAIVTIQAIEKVTEDGKAQFNDLTLRISVSSIKGHTVTTVPYLRVSATGFNSFTMAL
jgi:hypothetical protein